MMIASSIVIRQHNIIIDEFAFGSLNIFSLREMSRSDGPWLPFEGVGDSALELHFIVEIWCRCFRSVMFYHLESKILRGALDFILLRQY